MTNLENLKRLAESMGADASKATTNLEALNAIAVALGGEGNAMTNAGAIGEIAGVAGDAMKQNVEWADGLTGKFEITLDGTNNNTLKHIIKVIRIPDGITSTGGGGEMFGASTSLEKVIFPNNISVGSGSFGGCSKLIEVSAPNYNSAQWDGDEHTWESAFSGCTNLARVRVSYGVTKLDSTFSGCGVAWVELPPTLKSIVSAFQGCSKLTMLEIPESVEEIGQYTFSGCTNLAEINIHKPENSIEGAPWGATNATVNWLG